MLLQTRRRPTSTRRRRHVPRSAPAAASITLTTPAQYQCFQRSGKTGAIAISGTYTGSPAAIEASFNGGAYKTVVSSPAGGAFSGSLSSQPQGQGTLTVRFTNDTSVTASKTFVGVGEVFAVAGQSNAEGAGTNNQTYSSADGFKAGMVVQATGAWAELSDPTHTTGSGSPWPLLATLVMNAQHVPVAFLPTAVGGSSITEWQTGLGKFQTLRDRIIAAGGCRAVLWYQGENDVSDSMGTADYIGYFEAMAADMADETGYADIVWLPAKMPDYSGLDDADEAAIRAAFEFLWYANGSVRAGPDLQTVGNDGLHVRSDSDLADEAQRWYDALADAFYPMSYGIRATYLMGV